MTERRRGLARGQDMPVVSDSRFPVIGIGASAGGLAALRRFFGQMPGKPGMAFVVILHLSPRHASHADAVLQRCTRMPVRQVREPVRVEMDHVYVIAPTKTLTMNDGYLRVDGVERPPGRHVVIDRFFRTLADAHLDRSVGIVMSGTGSDGTAGLARVKEQGGVTLAQLPEDAEYEDMPRNAIASGRVDFVLPAPEMAAKLTELWANARQIQSPKSAPSAEHFLETPADTGLATERAFRGILEILLARTGHDFRHYKRATVPRRIERRMQVNLLRDLPSYRDLLVREPDEPRALLDDMLIGVTNFFRDREAFEALEREVIPGLFDQRETGPRVWVPGCASGEEAYSIAILLADHADELPTHRTFQVFASDIDEHAIAAGRTGVHPEAILTDVPPARRRQFFSREQNHYRINKVIRDRVLFALHDVLWDPPFPRVDLISCRNLLIYLGRDIQTHLLEMFHFALRPGGTLFLGSSESADAASRCFEGVDKRNRIFRARGQARGVRQPGMLPSRVVEQRPAQEIPRRQDRRGFSFADVHQRVLEYYVPPSVVVDHDSDIVHMSGSAGRYLQFGAGEPSSHLLTVVDPLLRLEQELQRTKDRLQATIEQSETSNEELKASNEKLQAINAELRSATEELETSKEELQSVNEELIMVDYELRSKVEETAKVNDDLQNFISSTDIATVFVDAGLRIKRYTPKAGFIFNIIPTDVGRCLLDITHRLEYPDLADDAARAFETLQMIEREIRSMDGKWFVARVVPYRTAENRIDGAVLTFLETTSLRATGQEGQAGVAHLDAGADCAILVTDAQRMITAVSSGARDLLGHGEQGLLGTRVDAIYVEEDRDAGAPEADFAMAVEPDHHEAFRWYLTRRGDHIHCGVLLNALRVGDTLAGFVVVLRPLRAAAAADAGTTPAGGRSGAHPPEASVTLRDEFLAVMSHELKNPLNLISVNAELVARLPELRESSNGMAAMETIRRAIRSQTRIIDDLLDMSRIRTGKLALKPEPVNIGMVVTELVEVVGMDATASGIEVRVQVPDVPIMVRGDAARIEQVIWNLLSNAIKFTPRGGYVNVAVGVEENFVRLQVKDTGRGIDAQSLPRIFDLFGQGTGRAVGEHGGLGIGLTLVRQLVELHGGRVEAQSDGPNRGATFAVLLPRFTYTLVAPAKSSFPAGGMRWDGLRILIVDDDAGASEGLAQLLHLEGAQVATANDGPRALELLAQQAFDVVVSDIGMAEMDGYAFARKVRASAGGAQVALVALSGYARPSDVHAASDAGFDSHLGKPLSMEALCAAVREALAQRGMQT